MEVRALRTGNTGLPSLNSSIGYSEELKKETSLCPNCCFHIYIQANPEGNNKKVNGGSSCGPNPDSELPQHQAEFKDGNIRPLSFLGPPYATQSCGYLLGTWQSLCAWHVGSSYLPRRRHMQGHFQRLHHTLDSVSQLSCTWLWPVFQLIINSQPQENLLREKMLPEAQKQLAWRPRSCGQPINSGGNPPLCLPER